MQTTLQTLQELIKEFENIKETKCKTIQEMLFFDGVLAIIEGKYLEKEKNLSGSEFEQKEFNLPTRKVCFFSLKDNKYMTENGIEITTEMLVKYPHQITDNWSFIVIE